MVNLIGTTIANSLSVLRSTMRICLENHKPHKHENIAATTQTSLQTSDSPRIARVEYVHVPCVAKSTTEIEVGYRSVRLFVRAGAPIGQFYIVCSDINTLAGIISGCRGCEGEKL